MWPIRSGWDSKKLAAAQVCPVGEMVRPTGPVRLAPRGLTAPDAARVSRDARTGQLCDPPALNEGASSSSTAVNAVPVLQPAGLWRRAGRRHIATALSQVGFNARVGLSELRGLC